MAKSEKANEKNIPNAIELTRDITVAWLNAYKTDLSIRRQRGVVPLFTPTNDEVAEFIAQTYQMIKDIEDGKEIILPSEKEKKQAEANKISKIELPLVDVKNSPVIDTASLLSSLPKADLKADFTKQLDLETEHKESKKGSTK